MKLKPLIVALDVDSLNKAMSIVKATSRHVDIYKVGPSLVMKYGPAIIEKIKKRGKKVFLDMKYHDIPNTVARTVEAAGRLGVYSATLHLSNGINALVQAGKVKRRPQLWGVSVLTSMAMKDLKQIGIKSSPLKQVMRLALLAKKSKLDGVVASVSETRALRKKLGKRIYIITPGIRLPENKWGDQSRVATPYGARQNGANFIVVGRPIIQDRDPGRMAKKIMEDWNRK